MRSQMIAVLLLGLGCGRIGYDGQSTGGDGGLVSIDALPAGSDARPDLESDAGVPFLGCSGGRLPLGSQDLVGFWSFNDRKGTDFSPSGQEATLSLSPSNGFTAGVVGQAMVLDGQTTCVTVPNSMSMNAGSGDFSVGLWVAGGCSPNTTLLSHGVPGAGESGFGLRCDANSELEVYAYDELGMKTLSGLLLTTGWHFLMVVKQSNDVSLYLDGELRGGFSATSSIASSDALYIGRSSQDTEYFAGAVDEIRVYKRALSAQEIRELFDYYRPGVIAHWPLDGNESGYAGLPYTGINVGGGVPFAAGRMGQAAAFNGAGGQIKFDIPDFFQTTYSAEVWFQTNSTGGQQSILNREVEPRAPIHLWVDDAYLKANIRGDGLVEVGTFLEGSFTDGCWHHAVLVREGGDLQDGRVSLYLDGALMSSATGTFGATAVASAPFTLGYRLDSDPRPFGGRIDEVRIFDRALTAEEIAALHRVGQTGD